MKGKYTRTPDGPKVDGKLVYLANILQFALNEWQVGNADTALHGIKEKTERETRCTHLEELTHQIYKAH